MLSLEIAVTPKNPSEADIRTAFEKGRDVAPQAAPDGAPVKGMPEHTVVFWCSALVTGAVLVTAPGSDPTKPYRLRPTSVEPERGVAGKLLLKGDLYLPTGELIGPVTGFYRARDRKGHFDTVDEKDG